jgi:hypothetical protein
MGAVLTDDEIDYLNKYGPKPEWLKTTSSNDKTSPNGETAGFCQNLPEWKPFPVEVLPDATGP